MQSEEVRAPWNEKTKSIIVTISQTLSSTQHIKVPEDFDETDTKLLKEIVLDQIELPSDSLQCRGYNNWIIDDFCVV